jgi:hypothetical protein
MAQLTGKVVRTEITQLEIVSDDGKRVITIEKQFDGSTKLVERDANELPYYGYNRTEYTIEPEQRGIIALAITQLDATYDRSKLDKISHTRFQIEQPEPEKVEEENCSPIAIADAQAAAALVAKEARIETLKFELRVDHTRDRHATGDVEGCPLCDAKVIPSARAVVPDNYDMTLEAEDDQADKIDLPF